MTGSRSIACRSSVGTSTSRAPPPLAPPPPPPGVRQGGDDLHLPPRRRSGRGLLADLPACVVADHPVQGSAGALRRQHACHGGPTGHPLSASTGRPLASHGRAHHQLMDLHEMQAPARALAKYAAVEANRFGRLWTAERDPAWVPPGVSVTSRNSCKARQGKARPACARATIWTPPWPTNSPTAWASSPSLTPKKSTSRPPPTTSCARPKPRGGECRSPSASELLPSRLPGWQEAG